MHKATISERTDGTTCQQGHIIICNPLYCVYMGSMRTLLKTLFCKCLPVAIALQSLILARLAGKVKLTQSCICLRELQIGSMSLLEYWPLPATVNCVHLLYTSCWNCQKLAAEQSLADQADLSITGRLLWQIHHAAPPLTDINLILRSLWFYIDQPALIIYRKENYVISCAFHRKEPFLNKYFWEDFLFFSYYI